MFFELTQNDNGCLPQKTAEYTEKWKHNWYSLYDRQKGQPMLAGIPVKKTTKDFPGAVSLPTRRCWRQLLHFAYTEDARVLLNGITYNVSISIP